MNDDDVPCTTSVPLSVFFILFKKQVGTKIRNSLNFHSNCHSCDNCQKIPTELSKLSFTQKYNLITNHSYQKPDATKRCICLSSSKWLPWICSSNKNSWWYFICCKPCLSYPFLPLFCVCWGIVNWRSGFWTHRTFDICIRCICLSSSKGLPRICSSDQNSWWYFICCKLCLSHPFLPLIFVCWGIVNWWRGFWTHEMFDVCIRCICLSSSKWLPRICSSDQNSWWYFICRKPCLSYHFLKC